ncbi:hypothetical protein PMI08_03151 [Brevibacillus sp. CF112]|uniref:hypothetical protein n=1 Tax=Brevibacillus sp. CF112 TaxID=1144311 RepID=UPI000271880F|nr:hypothetical protein [Brevibacillus sp. CF112]EJL42500.1 hypothetical protein PMI08_03151 [Brevibacillus sp. CF112]
MSEFSKQLGFLVAFLFTVALLQAFAGTKITVSFLALVLLGMLVYNADQFTLFLSRITHMK